MSDSPNSIDTSKRAFIKKASYVAPTIVTLSVLPSFASAGSGYGGGKKPKQKGNEGLGNGYDGPPPGHDQNYNDYEGTSPGNPGRQHPRGKR